NSSLPTRERGLKPRAVQRRVHVSMSLPTRERGLKQGCWLECNPIVSSLPTRERGLKPVPRDGDSHWERVAPHAGAWIETWSPSESLAPKAKSLPTRERGLKQHRDARTETRGGSLPTRERGLKLKKANVETWDDMPSLPTRERG